MMPPVEGASVDLKAPLSKWTVNSVFDHADRCNAVATSMIDIEVHALEKGNLKPDVRALDLALTQVRCVAPDDPRLKSN